MFFIPFLVTSQVINNTIYVNPDYSGGGNDGTITKPFTSLLDATMVNNTEYLIYKGTTDVFNDADKILIVERLNNIIIGAYGSGARPIISSASTDGNRAILEFRGCNYIKFDSIHVKGSAWSSGITQVGATIMVQEYYTHIASFNIEINNCLLEHAGWGIRAYGISGTECYNYTVDSTEIRYMEDDGIYFNYVETIEISYCNIHTINQAWDHVDGAHGDQNLAGGDCIQIARRGLNSHIHHNILDRSNSGHKFCLGFTDASYGINTAIIEYNEFISPRGDGQGGATLYLEELSDCIVRYNSFTNGHGVPQNSGIYIGANCDDNQVYYNTFDSLTEAYYGHTVTSDTTWFYNNVVYDMDALVQGDVILSKNNIYDSPTNGDEYSNYNTLVDSNNCYTSGYSGGVNTILTDPSFEGPTTGDFHLKVGSDCIDAGIPIYDITIANDYEGGVIGNPPNIGALEYLSSATTYTLKVNYGTGDGTYEATDVVEISAVANGDAYEVFDVWTGDVAYITNVNNVTTNVTMPAGNVTVTATFTIPTLYTLMVSNGTGDGNYPETTIVPITASVPLGYSFREWSGDIGYLDNPYSATTNVTMPGINITVTAIFNLPSPPADTGNVILMPGGIILIQDGIIIYN